MQNVTRQEERVAGVMRIVRSKCFLSQRSVRLLPIWAKGQTRPFYCRSTKVYVNKQQQAIDYREIGANLSYIIIIIIVVSFESSVWSLAKIALRVPYDIIVIAVYAFLTFARGVYLRTYFSVRV